jgi:adenylate cyclase
MRRNFLAPSLLAVAMSRVLGNWSRRFDDRFYGWLAVAIAALFIFDLTATRLIAGLEGNGYDSLIRYRISSPVPDDRILIVDIDERALSEVGKIYGRWPWPREVMAETVAAIADAQPKAIYTNILFSEPDLKNPVGDQALQMVADSYPNLAFPYIRLPEQNDALSSISAMQIPHAVARADLDVGADTVAIVPPVFASLERNMGYANLHPDEDGIIRSYRYWLPSRASYLPSAAASTLRLAGAPQATDSEGILLNWRNKSGSYKRISIAEVQAMLTGTKTFNPELFKDKIVIIGPSAPGVAVVKPTSSNQAMDDNEILATAIDDGLNGTALRTVPLYVTIAVSILTLLLLTWSFVRRVDQSRLDLLFGLGQAGLLAITFLSVSYTHYMIDLTIPFNVGLAYFVIARGYYSINEASWRGMDSFWDRLRVDRAERLVLILAQRDNPTSMKAIDEARRSVQKVTRVENLIMLSEVIEDRSFLGRPISNMVLFLVFADGDEEASKILETMDVHNENLQVSLLNISGLDLEAVRVEIWKSMVAGKLMTNDDS